MLARFRDFATGAGRDLMVSVLTAYLDRQMQSHVG